MTKSFYPEFDNPDLIDVPAHVRFSIRCYGWMKWVCVGCALAGAALLVTGLALFVGRDVPAALVTVGMCGFVIGASASFAFMLRVIQRDGVALLHDYESTRDMS